MAGKKSKVTENKSSICIGITAPIGVDINHIEACLKEEIDKLLNVELTVNKVTDLKEFNSTMKMTGYEKYKNRMDIGDNQRKKYGNDILAKKVCKDISMILP